MNFLRLFLRGLARMAVRSLSSRLVTSGASRAAVTAGAETAASGGALRMAGMVARETDDLVEDMMGQLDIIEIFDLAQNAGFMIENARQAAASGSMQAFFSVMGQMNPGQRALTENYCLNYIEEYWSTTDMPDPDDYLSGMYSQHEAIEQALSDTAEMSYESGRQEGVMSLYTDLGSYISQELLLRGLDMASVRRADADWSNFAAEISMERSEMEDIFASGDIPSHLRMRYINGRLEYMTIGDRAGMSGPGTRQLSWGQFFGSDQPYWFTESTRMRDAWIRGDLSYSEMESKRAELYSATFRNPWSTSPPAGYHPVRGI